MNKWDQYFLTMCNTVATNGKCMSRVLGAIIVFDKSIISTGYNGPPRGVPACGDRFKYDEMYQSALKKMISLESLKDIEVMIGKDKLENTCPRRILNFNSGYGVEYCPAGHAERNALINAARHGIATRGATLYLNTNIPCKECLIEITNAGIVEVVCTELKYYDSLSEYIISQSNLKIRTYDL